MDVRVGSDGNLACPRCGREPYLQAALPDPAADGGYTTVVLCPTCDVTTASAQTLLAFFAVHRRLTPHNVAEFADLVTVWLEDIAPATVSDAQLKNVVDAWTGR